MTLDFELATQPCRSGVHSYEHLTITATYEARSFHIDEMCMLGELTLDSSPSLDRGSKIRGQSPIVRELQAGCMHG
ncbi:hypothetical protein TNCV_772121 [Trichonephila clavipes]|nr:hypothetical protein TNCV_772121 [Trichonephila clavipes]